MVIHKSANAQDKYGAFTTSGSRCIIRNGQNYSDFFFRIRNFHPFSYLTLPPPLYSAPFVRVCQQDLTKLSDRFPLNLVEGWGKVFQTDGDEIFRSGGIQLSGATRLSLQGVFCFSFLDQFRIEM